MSNINSVHDVNNNSEPQYNSIYSALKNVIAFFELGKPDKEQAFMYISFFAFSTDKDAMINFNIILGLPGGFKSSECPYRQ